jgi:glycosyltransferase 2 family protein
VTSAHTIIRSFGRNRISVPISLLIVTAAAVTLYVVLRDVDFAKVVAAVEAQSLRGIATAGALVVAGYVTLTFYDLFALRTIGRRTVPFQVAAFASFTSYTIGHTLGAATLTGGVVRHRIYSVWGLSVLDVAKIAFITGMTFWLGTAFVLGGALTYAPDAGGAVDHLPSSINRLIGLSGLSAIVGYLGWLLPRPRTVGYANWKIVLPNVRFTLVQIAIGALDLSLVTLALYTLLPANPPVDFISVLIIFLTATFLGAVSYVPGNLGIIEAALLIGLPQFPKEDLLAALLTFRVLYFIIPVCLAMLVLGLYELRLVARPTTTSQRP